MIFFLVFITGYIAATVLTPLAEYVSRRTGAMDQPAPRRVNKKPIARLGGIPLFVGFLAAGAVSLVFPRTDTFEMTRLVGLAVGSAFLFVVGLIDDYLELSSAPQLVAQLIAAGIVVASGVTIREIPNPFGGSLPFETWFAVAFTLFWLAGMINTINWLDGIDGLASGVVVIAGGVIFFHTARLEQYSISLVELALIGPVAGFLVYNLFPARIFMGSAGANVLGFGLGVLAIIGGAKVATALLVLLIPILDVAWQIFSRLRAGKSPFAADRAHLHHRLLDLGYSQRAIVLMYYALTALFGVLALVLPSGQYKLIALVLIGSGALLVLVKLRRPAANPS